MITLKGQRVYLGALEKAGFALEGRLRKAEYIAGRRWDRLEYSILAEEWCVGL